MAILISPSASISPTAVTDRMFGANTLWHIDDISEQFTGNMESFHVGSVRWPGGTITEAYLDLADPDSFIDSPRRWAPEVDPDHILTFSEIMTWASDNDRTVDIVLPTMEVLYQADPTGFRYVNWDEVEKVKQFIIEAMSPDGKYTDAKIASVEIGNEYWGAGFTSEDYGRVANILAKAIDEGARESGAGYDPDILVQIGEPWGIDFDEGGKYYQAGLTWGQQLQYTNQDIIAQLDNESRLIVDGLVDHVFYNVDSSANLNWTLNKVQSTWKNAGLNYDYHFSEWNALSYVPAGMTKFAIGGVMLETFENLVRVGAKSAYVWPINQTTLTDLAGAYGVGPGHLSVTGAAFKLLSENVRDHYWVGTDLEADPRFEISLYAKADSGVLFISSTMSDGLEEDIDLSRLFAAAGIGENVILTTARIERDLAEDVSVGAGSGAKIVYEASDNALANTVSPSLAGFEILMAKAVNTGTSGIMTGTDHAESFYGGSVGNLITAGGGDDRIWANGGNDTLYGGDGDDQLHGGDGADILRGGAGADYLDGGSGQDRADYSNAAAGVIADLEDSSRNSGEAAGDIFLDIENLHGSKYDDELYGSDQANTLWGHKGQDILDGGAGNDMLFGGRSGDIFVFALGSDRDQIRDFENDIDTINLSDFGISSFAEASAYAVETKGRVIFDFGDGDVLTVLKTTLAQLSDDLIFA